MIAVAKTKQPNTHQPPLNPPHKRPPSPWLTMDIPDEEPSPSRGTDAVQHQAGARGRRSVMFPDLNITATAEKLGITKSHLAKILSGRNKPSLDLAEKIADALKKDLAFVAALGHNTNRQPDKQANTGKAKKKRK